MNKQITNEGVRITDIEYLILHTIIRLPLECKMINYYPDRVEFEYRKNMYIVKIKNK